MRTASSASRTWRAPASASEDTAMVRSPNRAGVRKMRQAISPRLATRRLLITAPSDLALHPEHAKVRRLLRRVAHRRERQPQYAPRFDGIDHAIVPQARRGIIRMSLALVLLANRLLECLLVRHRPVLTRAPQLVTLDGREHAGGLLPAHDRDARVRPLKQEPGRIRPAAHGVVPGAVAAADDHGKLRHAGAGHRRDQLRAVLGDAACFRAPPDHE